MQRSIALNGKNGMEAYYMGLFVITRQADLILFLVSIRQKTTLQKNVNKQGKKSFAMHQDTLSLKVMALCVVSAINDSVIGDRPRFSWYLMTAILKTWSVLYYYWIDKIKGHKKCLKANKSTE